MAVAASSAAFADACIGAAGTGVSAHAGNVDYAITDAVYVSGDSFWGRC